MELCFDYYDYAIGKRLIIPPIIDKVVPLSDINYLNVMSVKVWESGKNGTTYENGSCYLVDWDYRHEDVFVLGSVVLIIPAESDKVVLKCTITGKRYWLKIPVGEPRVAVHK